MDQGGKAEKLMAAFLRETGRGEKLMTTPHWEVKTKVPTTNILLIVDGGEMVDGLMMVIKRCSCRMWKREEERKIRVRNGKELGYNYQIGNKMTLMLLYFEPVK